MCATKTEGSTLGSAGVSILVADTDETQAYVFESNRLPEIRGASRQLDQLNVMAAKMVGEAGGSVVFAGGGSLLALVDTDKAENMARTIEATYISETVTATTSAASRSLPSDYQRFSFGDYVRWAGRWLRRHKENKEPPPFIEAIAFNAVCQSCQRRPADASLLGRFGDRSICSVCYRKHQSSQKRGSGTETWHGLFENWLGKAENTELRDQYLGGSSWDKVDIPQAIDEIANTHVGRDGYVAMVYLDGDRIGQLLTQMTSIDEYRALSEELTGSMHEAVFSALAQELHPVMVTGSQARKDVGQADLIDKDVLIHPFEIITIGGDDAILLLPSSAAIPIASQVGQTFSARVTKAVGSLVNGKQPVVTMSAGVAIGDDHTPVQQLFELSLQLLKEAKKAGGALDFHILKSADMIDRHIAIQRESFPFSMENLGDNGKHLRLTARPYSYLQLDRLWSGAIDLAEVSFPTSQLGQLVQALLEGRRTATLFYQYQRHRSEDGAYKNLDNVLSSLYGAGTRDPLPWRSVPDQSFSHDTMLWDLAELFEFVPRNHQWLKSS
jgi:hypothetical protein